LDVSVVVPMFNEEDRVADLCRAILRWSPPFGRPEIVLVDDGSTDRTAAIVEERLEGTEVTYRFVQFDHNRGKGAAVREGIAQSSGAYVAYLDADLSVDLDQFERGLELMVVQDADVAVGSRRHPETVIPDPQPLLRRLSGMCFNLMVRGLGLSHLRDTQCGLKIFKIEAARQIFPNVECEGFAFDVEVLYVAERLGLKVLAVPVVWNHREASRVRPVKDGTRMARALVGIRRRCRGLAKASTAAPSPLGRVRSQ